MAAAVIALVLTSEITATKGVTIVGLTDLPSRMACQASQLLWYQSCHPQRCGWGDYKVDVADEVVRVP